MIASAQFAVRPLRRRRCTAPTAASPVRCRSSSGRGSRSTRDDRSCAPKRCAISSVPSREPESTTTISAQKSAASRQRSMFCSSFRVITTSESGGLLISHAPSILPPSLFVERQHAFGLARQAEGAAHHRAPARAQRPPQSFVRQQPLQMSRQGMRVAIGKGQPFTPCARLRGECSRRWP